MKKLDLGEWMELKNIKPDGYGGLDYNGTQFTAYEIEKMHKNSLGISDKKNHEQALRLAFQAGARRGYCLRSKMANIGATCDEPDEDEWIELKNK